MELKELETKFPIGRVIKFKTDNDRVPSGFTCEYDFGCKSSGFVIFKQNKGVIVGHRDERIVVKYEDKQGKFLTLGFLLKDIILVNCDDYEIY